MGGTPLLPGACSADHNKDVPFDRYEFFDGTRIVPVEGRLTTIVAEGKGASAHEILKTYESLVAGLGGSRSTRGSKGGKA